MHLPHSLRTEYFPAHIVWSAIGECCQDFALALHRRTGWEIGCLWRDETDGGLRRSCPVHVFCAAPNGFFVDAEGAAPADEMKARYASESGDGSLRTEFYGDELSYTAAVSEALSFAAPALRPRESGTAAAARVIGSSPRFLALLDGLGLPPPPGVGPGEAARQPAGTPGIL